jgi:hypothetical protein
MNPGNLYQYLIYRLKARSKFDIHSPFIYKIWSQVLKDRKRYQEYNDIEAKFPDKKNLDYYRLLFRLQRYFQPDDIVFSGKEDGREIAYLSFGIPPEKIYTDIAQADGSFELVFIDLLTVENNVQTYFSQWLQHTHNDSVIVLWNLRESKSCMDRWEKYRKMPKVTVTVDLFQVGLIFFRKELSREDFILHF